MVLDGLTPQQRDAVTHPAGPLLVVAGAGAGKTRVLTHRLAWLVDGGAEPSQIVALTFSAQAAEELRVRAEALLGRAHETLRVMTFHSFAGEIARIHGVEHGLLPPAVWATEEERALLLLDRIGELDLVAHDLRGDPGRVVGDIIRRIERCKNELVSADDFVRFADLALQNATDRKQRRERLRDLEFARAYSAHDRWLAEAGLVDFGEAIVRSVHLLRNNADRLSALRETVRHVMVDEFQDTDHAQSQLLYLMADTAQSVVAVGDDDQGIYRFRGASTKNIADFRARYPKRNEIRLELNHRSTQSILDAAHAVVVRVSERADKRLSALPDAAGPLPRFWVAPDEDGQARAIAEEIRRLVGDEGIALEEQAILMDSVRTEAPAMVRALEAAGIPHQVHGGLGVFERREVREALAWLRVLADPDDAQAHLRLVADPDLNLPWGESVDAVASARAGGTTATGALLTVAERGTSPFAARLSEVGPIMTGPTIDVVREVIDRAGLRLRALSIGGAEGAARLAGLSALERLATDLARRDGDLTPAGLVRQLMGLSDVGHRGRLDRPRERAGVQVSTIHQSKGLEFDAVFVVGLVASRMPGRDRRGPDIPDELLPETIQRGRDAHIDEKRRLTYVALTRARRHLILSTYDAGERTRQRPSMFFDEAREAVDGAQADRVGESPDGPILADIAVARARLEEAGRAAASALATNSDGASALVDAAQEALQELIGVRARALVPTAAPEPLVSAPSAPPSIDISPSDLQTYRTCPLRYKYARIDRIPQRDRPGGKIGTAAHLALEAHYRPGGSGGDGEALVQRFAAELDRLGVSTTPEGEQALRRGREHLPAYHARITATGTAIAGVERRFTLPLGRHTVRGRVDRIDRHPSGGFLLIDYKTGRPPVVSGAGDEDIVLALYVEAASVNGAKIHGARLEHILDGETRVFDPDPAERAALVADAERLADEAASGRFEPRPGWHCSSCDYQMLCPARDR